MRFQSYLNIAVNLINRYHGDKPLMHYLKNYFSHNKKHGSKDRKYISHLCYCCFRMGYSLKDLPTEEKIKSALFLCSSEAGEWTVLFDADYLQNWHKKLKEKLQFIHEKYPSFEVDKIFPFALELTESIDATAFGLSHLVQPDLFLRLRPGKRKQVVEKLTAHSIAFTAIADDCLAIANTTKIDSVIELNREAVIQDYSSQRIKEFLQLKVVCNNRPVKVWDCCAASGGKSILAVDTLGKIELTVSDIRPSIINNLRLRFKEAGIKNYNSFIGDLTFSRSALSNAPFDFIICDAPCTGSGTWGRTPEQLTFIKAEKILEYAGLQKKIVTNAIPHLKMGGYFLYITCSVFKKENEEAADFISSNFNVKKVKQELLKGYDKKADTMFAALFVKL